MSLALGESDFVDEDSDPTSGLAPWPEEGGELLGSW